KSGDLTTAIVPAGTSFPAVLREPCDLVCSLRGDLLLRPVELGSVDPHPVQNDRELARDGDCGLAEPFVAFSLPGCSERDAVARCHGSGGRPPLSCLSSKSRQLL